jgi:hypothetical protein
MTLGHRLLSSLGLALAAALVLGASPAIAAPSAVLAFLDGPRAFERLERREGLAIGTLGAQQGAYTRRQALLDMSAGSRVSRSGYTPEHVPAFTVARGRVAGWDAVARRAASAPGRIVPGALASAAPGGAVYAGPPGRLEAVLAADRGGRLRPGPGARLLVTVVDDAGLDRLLRDRPPDRLVLVVETPPVSGRAQALALGAAGLGMGLLTSRTTRLDGFVAATDLAPTILEHLGAPVPGHVRGRAITAGGARDAASARALAARLRVVSPRQPVVLLTLLGAIAATGLALRLAGRGRLGARIAGLAALFIPLVALGVAALAPAYGAELALTAGLSLALAAATDRLVAWPRAAAVPALAGIAAYAVDLARGSDWIVRSLLGPNPLYGSRYFGIGNELEATLPVLALVALAAVAGRRPRSRALALAAAGWMLALGVVIGAGRLGADVGGVITVGAAGAATVLLLLPGGVSRRALALAALAPVAALAALVVLDVVTGGDAHLTRTVLDADSPGAVGEVIARRYELAWNAFLGGAMPVLTVLAAGAAVVAIRRRRALYAVVADRPAWGAALAGGLAGSVVGALANDSGPVLLVIGVVLLAVTTLYLRGAPRAA